MGDRMIEYGTVMILASLLVLGSERKSGLWYSEHAKFWCNQKMPCWRRLVPHICEDPGMLQCFVPFYNINQYYILASFQFIINNVCADSWGPSASHFWQQFTSGRYISCNASGRITSHLFQNEQTYKCVPGDYRCLRVSSIIWHNLALS